MNQRNRIKGTKEMGTYRHTELQTLLEEFDAACRVLEEKPSSDEAQCNACLISRSAYTEFFSVCELDGKIDEIAACQLKTLLETILKLLPADGKYFESVSNRLNDFNDYCEDVSRRDPWDTAVAF